MPSEREHKHKHRYCEHKHMSGACEGFHMRRWQRRGTLSPTYKNLVKKGKTKKYRGKEITKSSVIMYPRDIFERRPVDMGSLYRKKVWQELRQTILSGYGAVCMRCGSTEKIVVDHIKSAFLHPHLVLEEKNLQVLCNKCNIKKGRYGEEDYRPSKPEQPKPAARLAREKKKRLFAPKRFRPDHRPLLHDD